MVPTNKVQWPSHGDNTNTAPHQTVASAANDNADAQWNGYVSTSINDNADTQRNRYVSNANLDASADRPRQHQSQCQMAVCYRFNGPQSVFTHWYVLVSFSPLTINVPGYYDCNCTPNVSESSPGMFSVHILPTVDLLISLMALLMILNS
jgi:hypothetical protein